MTAERANLLACLEHATIARQHVRVVGLTAALAAHLRTDGPWQQALTLHAAAATAAEHLGDPAGQAGALTELGFVRRLTGDYPGATAVLQQALDTYRDLRHRLGQAGTLNELGVVRRLTGDYPGAAAVLEQALDTYRDIGSRLGQAGAFYYLGIVRY
jgi:tetratricopeptide (TPR) repeat protein